MRSGAPGEEQAAKHGFDVKAILTAARRRQRRSKRKIASFVGQGASARSAEHLAENWKSITG
jgi:hypothetical protein